jgi:hypothetical protein
MTDIEKLAKQIIAECEKEGEPVTKEEALEMAEMEINANGNRRYEQSAKPRKATTKVRKVDEEKLHFLNGFIEYLRSAGAIVELPKSEAELNFKFGENDYTIKLIKHRKKG